MIHLCRTAIVLLVVCSAMGAEWTQFRGPHGLGTSTETGLPVEWSAKDNIAWRTELPGPGSSSPITVGKRIFLTCYTGYALDPKAPGDMNDLRRHVVCVERTSGKILWTKEFMPLLPEHKYTGEGTYHGYAASTPTTDGQRLYVFFGKAGVYCLDLDGEELWHTLVGKNISGWGSAASPLLYKDLLIINASVESGALVALDRHTGKEVWRAGKINSAWDTPLLVTLPGGAVELVISTQDRLRGFDPDKGTELWNADGIHRYVCPSVVAHDGVVYAIGGGHTSLAVRAGGRGDVTETHTLWRTKPGSNVSSPVYHQGHLYWADDNGGVVNCQDAATGKFVYRERLKPDAGRIYASALLADGKIYYVTREKGTYVVAASPQFKQLAHNVFADDPCRTNATPAVSDGLLLRTDQYLYCIGSLTCRGPPLAARLTGQCAEVHLRDILEAHPAILRVLAKGRLGRLEERCMGRVSRRRHVGGRQQPAAQSLQVEALGIGKSPVLVALRAEQGAKHGRPEVGMVHLAIIGPVLQQQRLQRPQERRGVGAARVPQEHHAAAQPQHAQELAPRPGHVEPVKRLSRDDQVDAAFGQRGLLRAAGDAVKPRLAAESLLGGAAHRAIGLDAVDDVPRRKEQLGRQPRAGADVGDDRIRGQTGLAAQHIEHLRRIAGTVADVVGHAIGETVSGVHGKKKGTGEIPHLYCRRAGGGAAVNPVW